MARSTDRKRRCRDRRRAGEPIRPSLLERGGERAGSPADWERVRIDHGSPRWGVDFDARQSNEAALDQRAELDGRHWARGVCMQDMRGKLKRRVVALCSTAKCLPGRGCDV
jgi:hypothetical protein